LLRAAEILPAVNSVSPYLKAGVVITAAQKDQSKPGVRWKGRDLPNDPLPYESPRPPQERVAQIVLRWEIQSGIVTIRSPCIANGVENAAFSTSA
jgi:diketogulonate reductase-like aldo/keto reductase